MLTNIQLRGLDEQLIHTLKQTALKKKISTNKLILTLLQQALEPESESKRGPHVYHDLDSFAGTWSHQETKAFLKNTADFEKIDEELWK